MTIARATLPAEFFDITSAMMLVQPEPQYSYAQMLFAGQARAALSAEGVQLGVAPDRGPAHQGAPIMDLEQQQLALGSAPMAEAIKAVPECGAKGVGHTIRINRPVFAGGGYTEASRVINATTSISTTPIDLTSEQVSITVKRVVGPFASGGTTPQPYAIDKFDAKKSVHDLSALVGLQLSRDRMKYLDSILSLLFDQPANIVRPGGATTDAAAFVANFDAPMDLDTLYRAEQKLEELNIPRFADGTYAFICSPQQLRQLKSDNEWTKASALAPAVNPLLKSFVGNVGGTINVFRSNTNQTDTASVSNVTINHGVMFGPGAVGFGIDEPCRVASANEDNYGETAKVVWIAYEGSTLLDNRFIVGVHTD
jgi:hypothetical protein